MLDRYIGNSLFNAFLSFFIPLFGIASLIFFIKIVSVTAIIKITFFELMQMYIFILPQILFFTLPIAFFAAGVAALHRLSFEYETIALFSLGVSPSKVVTVLAKIAFFFSVLAILFSLILIPQAKQIYKGFIIHKKSEAKLNIKPSEFGHRFGDWYLYLGHKRDGVYKNVALYNNRLQNQENFIVAKEAKLLNTDTGLELVLLHGNAYTYEKKELKEIAFEKMSILDTSSGRAFHYTDPFEYWFIALSDKKRAFDFTLFVLIALFPLASIHFIALFAIHNPRFKQKGPFILSLFYIAIYFAFAFALAKALTFKALLLLPFWFLIGYMLFHYHTLRRF